jgi:hypothetical protein
VREALVRRGWEVRPARAIAGQRTDVGDRFAELYARSGTATMTSLERMYALYEAVRHVERAGVPGDIVECGVWRGGSCMLAALALLDLGTDERDIWLYDTFAGMTEPTDADRSVHGLRATRRWQALQRQEDDRWCHSPLEEVRSNMASTSYPAERLHYVEGRVEDTIPASMPRQIALLRLDTDWYESTRHELTHLYPLLAPGGVLILDDYGHWLGSKQAVDEYFAEMASPMLLHRIDGAGRIGVKVV